MKKILFYIFMFVICLYSVYSADCNYLATKLDKYYSFDTGNYSGTNVFDLAGLNHNGTTTGAHLGDSGIIGKGIYFDGNDYMSSTQSTLGTSIVSFGGWIKLNSTADNQVLFMTGQENTNKDVQVSIPATNYEIDCGVWGVGVINAKKVIAPNTWTHFACVYTGGNSVSLYINGTLIGTDSPTYQVISDKENMGGINVYFFEGNIDEFFFSNKTINSSDISDLYNSGVGCNPFTPANTTPPEDTTPPTIIFLNQTPSDINVFNIVTTGVTINYSVTDASGLNKTYLELTINNSYIVTNGTKETGFFNITDNISPFSFFLDDNKLLSGVYNYNESLMESTTHFNTSYTGQNTYLKIEFLNVSNDRNYSFYEYMGENGSISVCDIQFYYCNSSYITGSIVTSDYCSLFYQETNGAPYNHSHSSNSKHKVIPLVLSNKMVGTVGISPTSYIVKRFCADPTLIFWINKTARTNAVQTSGNNGNTYSSLNIIPDAHMHILSSNESINYRVCSYDNTTNLNFACSAYRSDAIGFINLFPSAPEIITPTATTYFSSTPIYISWNPSISQINLNITNYMIEYKTNLSLYFIANVTNLNYSWTISTLAEGYYQIRVTAKDTYNQTSYAESELFYIDIMPTLSEVLLLDLNTTLTDINNGLDNLNIKVTEGINMFILVVFLLICLAFAYFTQAKLFYSGVGVCAFLLALVMFYQTNLPETYGDVYKTVIGSILSIASIVLIFFGLWLQFRKETTTEENDYQKRMYKY